MVDDYYDDNNLDDDLNITYYTERKSCKDSKNSCYYVFTVLFFPLVFVISMMMIYSKSSNKRKSIVANFDNFFTEKGENDNISRNCVICYENICYNDLIFTKCGHYYHEFCIKKWLSINQVCPICKRQFELNL
jgi:hypothetical protein